MRKLWMLLAVGLLCSVIAAMPLKAQVAAASGDESSENVISPSGVVNPRFVSVSPDAAELGFRPEKLETIDKKFSRLLESEKIVGVSAFIARQGKEVFYGHWGFQDKEKKIPLDRKSIVRIYSMTKPITSVAAMQLVENGKLELDAAVSKYLPEFENLKVLEGKGEAAKEVEPKRKMTVRDLLRHTSGLTYGFFGNSAVDQEYRKLGVLITDIKIKTTVKKLASIPLLYHPGSQFHYSVSTDVLGRVIEIASGEKLDDYFQKHIFEPLGMEDTFFSVPKAKQDRLMQLYANRRGKPIEPASAMNSVRYLNERNKFFSGGGGLCSTVDDYFAFSQMLLNKGTLSGKRILSEETVNEMYTNQLVEIERSPGKQFQFGLGLRCFPKGDFGWGGAAGTKFWVHPEKETIIIYMIQMMPDEGRKHHEILRGAAYSALKVK